MLTREQLLSSFVRRYADVETTAGAVRIQNLTEAETAAYQHGQVNSKGEFSEAYAKIRRQRLVAAVLVDADGRKLLDQSGDAAKLSNVDGGVISAIFVAALKHCGLLTVEEGAEKNSAPTSGDGSPTG